MILVQKFIKPNAFVFQLSREGKTTSASSTGGETINVLRTYNFEGIYPNC